MAKKSTLPQDSVLHSYIREQDYVDSFATDISGKIDLLNCDMRELATQFGTIELGWAQALLKLRNILMRPFMMKTTDKLAAEAANKPALAKQVGDRIAFFRIFAIHDNEIILGEDDWHQDFRVSLYRRNGDYPEVIMTTVCQRHNLFGHAYLAIILPFHKLIVKSTLEDGANKPLIAGRR